MGPRAVSGQALSQILGLRVWMGDEAEDLLEITDPRPALTKTAL